ncbi:MAG: type II toxin-antitoxin system VapC family toxin [Pirellulales bacterium]
MIFADLPAGARVFLDANHLIYYFGSHPTFGAACSQLVQRIENQELVGFTSTHLLSEVAHRLMIIEAAALPGFPSTKVMQYLKRQPTSLQGLSRFRTAVETVLQSKIQVLTIAPSLVAIAAAISQQPGLLSNDALTVAVMQHHNLSQLASHDADFDRVPGLVRYAPA